MTERNDGGPAFPTTAGQTVYSHGMFLRDYFAGQALAAIIAKHPPMGVYGSVENGSTKTDRATANRVYEQIAQGAYNYADAMLEARK